MNDEVQQIEISIEQAQKMVDLGKACERLRQNPDFQKVIMEGYFKEEPIRLVFSKADPSLQKPELQQAIDHDIRAIGTFRQYFDNIFHFADMAKRAVEDGEATLAEIHEQAEVA